MNADLQDALVAWQGGELPPGRAEELLTRLRNDEGFRSELATEAWTLSLSRIAQAPDPRWLGLMEELGIAGPERDGDAAFEGAVMESFRAEPVRFVSAWWRRATYGAIAAAVALAVGITLRGPRESKPQASATAKQETLAVVIQAENAEWKDSTARASGSAVGAERVQLAAGRVSLMFTSGVMLDFEGPADLELIAADRVICREGRLRTRVPKGAEGFCVETPSGAVTDLGTEFGVSIAQDGKTHVSVFEGKAEISLSIPGQQGVRTATLTEHESAEMMPGSGTILPQSTASFLPASTVQLPPLTIDPAYAETIREAKPTHYWRLDREEEGTIPNEISGAPSLRLAGSTTIEPDASGHRSARFLGPKSPGVLYMDEPWSNSGKGHSTELWFAADGVERSSLIALVARSGFDPDRAHFALTEVGSRRPGRGPEAGVVRTVLRWPPRNRDGMSLDSSPAAFPYQWHHVVAQQSEGQLELFIDGKSIGAAQIGGAPEAVECSLFFGCLYFYTGADLSALERQFSGRMAEIAIYDRLLTPSEIHRHASLGGHP